MKIVWRIDAITVNNVRGIGSSIGLSLGPNPKRIGLTMLRTIGACLEVPTIILVIATEGISIAKIYIYIESSLELLRFYIYKRNS